MPEKKPYFDNLVGHKEEIRGIVKPLAESAKQKYDPEEFKEAPAQVRLKLGTEWMKKLASRMPEGKKIEPNQIWASLGITQNTPHEEAVAIIRDFQSTHGLEADGIIGPKTLEALDNASGGEGSFNQAVKKLNAQGEETGETYGTPDSTPPTETPTEGEKKPKLTPEQKKAKREFKTAQNKLTKIREDQSIVQGKLKEFKDKKGTLEEDVKTKQASVDDAESKHNESVNNLTGAKDKVEQKTTELKTASGEAMLKKAEAVRTSTIKVTADAALQEAENTDPKPANIETLRQAAATAKTNFDKASADSFDADQNFFKIQKEKEALESKVTEAEKEEKELATKLENAKTERDDAQKELDDVNHMIMAYEHEIIDSTENELQAEEDMKKKKEAFRLSMNPPDESGEEREEGDNNNGGSEDQTTEHDLRDFV